MPAPLQAPRQAQIELRRVDADEHVGPGAASSRASRARRRSSRGRCAQHLGSPMTASSLRVGPAPRSRPRASSVPPRRSTELPARARAAPRSAPPRAVSPELSPATIADAQRRAADCAGPRRSSHQAARRRRAMKSTNTRARAASRPAARSCASASASGSSRAVEDAVGVAQIADLLGGEAAPLQPFGS